jgi:hypothetical protein
MQWKSAIPRVEEQTFAFLHFYCAQLLPPATRLVIGHLLPTKNKNKEKPQNFSQNTTICDLFIGLLHTSIAPKAVSSFSGVTSPFHHLFSTLHFK